MQCCTHTHSSGGHCHVTSMDFVRLRLPKKKFAATDAVVDGPPGTRSVPKSSFFPRLRTPHTHCNYIRGSCSSSVEHCKCRVAKRKNVHLVDLHFHLRKFCVIDLSFHHPYTIVCDLSTLQLSHSNTCKSSKLSCLSLSALLLPTTRPRPRTRTFTAPGHARRSEIKFFFPPPHLSSRAL